MRSRRHLAPYLLVPLIAIVVLWLFAWPAARLAPRDLGLGVAGPDAAVTAVEDRLAAQAGADGFDVHRYAGEREARGAVEEREVYGAVVIGQDGGRTLMTASAASPVVANLLSQALAGPSADTTAAHGTPVEVVDVVPLPAGDPRGSVFNSLVLPLLMAGAAGTMVCVRFTRSLAQCVSACVGSSALLGLAVTALAQGWLGALGGDWLADAGVVALIALAVSSFIAGLTSLCGGVGTGLAAVVMVLIGNATSGATSAPELLPRGVAWIGRLLPPGAGATALRSTAFFDGHAVGRPLTVLAGWSVLGVALIVLGALRSPARKAGGRAPAQGEAPRRGPATRTAAGGEAEARQAGAVDGTWAQRPGAGIAAEPRVRPGGEG